MMPPAPVGDNAPAPGPWPPLLALVRCLIPGSCDVSRRKDQDDPRHRVVARNRRARFEYDLEATVEAGIALLGTEVKALREGQASLEQAYCRIDAGEVWLVDANIPPYQPAGWANHEPTRRRKLLLHASQIRKLAASLKVRGRTLIPLRLYFNERGMVKLEIAVAVGRKRHDKRQAMAERDARREVDRALKRR